VKQNEKTEKIIEHKNSFATGSKNPDEHKNIFVDKKVTYRKKSE
jgi:hypothetical protein